jgi:hypothetical protein
MRNIILILSLTFTFNTAFSQDFETLAKYEFKAIEDYKTSENTVLVSANYLLNTPSKGTDTEMLKRIIVLQYIMKWMEGTPDYTFEIGELATSLTKGNDDLFGLYLTTMSKVVLDNKGTTLSINQIHNKTQDLLITYCSDSKNKMKSTKSMKKIIRSRK